jgi:hypothetical protein
VHPLGGMVDLQGMPPRTKLPPLEPIGIGKSHIEALSGFVTRLAAELSVSVGILFSELLAKVPNPYAGKALYGHQREEGYVHVPRDYQMNGNHDQARKWVYALESVTQRKNLYWHTLLPFGGAFILRLRKRAAWCPACLEEARSTNKPVFEPLLWSVLEVTHCPIHSARLVFQCRACGHTFFSMRADHRSGYCGYCKAWLGSCAIRSDLDESVRDGVWESKQVASIIPLGVSMNFEGAMARLRSRLNTYIEVATGTNIRRFAELVGMHEGKIRSWLKPNGTTPCVSGLLLVAKRLNVPLSTFYNRDGPTVDELKSAQLVGHDVLLAKSPSRNSTTMRGELLKALSGPPVSLADVAKNLGYNKLHDFYRNHSDLAKRITARFVAAGKRRPRDVEQLRIAMEQNLRLDQPEPAALIACRQGYSDAWARNKYPQLYAATRARRAEILSAWKAQIRYALERAKQEDPPPSIPEVYRRLQMQNDRLLLRHQPELTILARSRHKIYQEEQARKLRSALELALMERPVVPPLTVVAQRAHISVLTLKKRLPDLTAQIAKQHKLTLNAEARRRYDLAFSRVKSVVEEVAARGVYPSYRHVAPQVPQSICKPTSLYVMLKSVRRSLGYIH